MIITRKSIHRRAFLKGLGVALALPTLDAMTPALASTPKAPVRLAFVYLPNGMDMRNWNPNYEGPFRDLPSILKPLEPLRNDFLSLGNLTNAVADAWQDGPGDHGRACGGYLNGVHVYKSTTEVHAGVSVDQLVAKKIGAETRFPSLELGLEDARQTGSCDSGYACAYTNNLAWRTETQPLPPILEPRSVFERLFGDGITMTPEARARENALRRSILDYVNGDLKKLQGALGPGDRRKLDQYATAVRDIELQIERAERDNAQINPGMEKPYGTPSNFAEHFKLISDMTTVAFQADLTRVVTFLVTREGTPRPYPEIGVPEGHHPLTHHRNEVALMDKVAHINTYHVAQFAKWLERLKAIKEGDGNMLENSIIVYGAGLADGNSHSHEDLPTLVAGHGGGAFKPGRRIVYQKQTPMTNLFVTILDRMGLPAEQFGDSTGRLEGLDLA
jgi:hypothetical protein